MDSKPKPVYEDFEVHKEWVHEAADDTLIAYLPGFKKEQLKVQVTTGGKLRISGERPLGDNKFSRFHHEIPIPSNCDQNKIKANFRGGMLHIKLPKLIVPADNKPQEEAKPSAVNVPKTDPKPAPQPPRPADIVPQKQKNGSEQAAVHQDAPPEAAMEKQADKDNAASEADEKTTEKLGDSVKDGAEKENIEPKKMDGSNYKQAVEGLVKGMKNPRKVMNMVLGVLLAAVLAVYIRNVIRWLWN